MSVIDILFLAIVIVFAVLAYRRGLLKTVLEVVAFFAAIILAIYVATPTANLFYNSFVKSSVEKRVKNEIQEINFNGKITADQASKILADNIPEFILDIAEGTGISKGEIVAKAKQNQFDSIQATNAIMEKVVEPIAVPAIKAITFIMLSAVFMFLFRLFAKLMAGEAEHDGFSLNNLLGGFLGIAKGVVVVYVVCAALQLIYYSNADTSAGFGKILSDSQIFNFMIEKNPIVEGLKNML